VVERDRSGRRVRLMGSGRVARVREAVRSVIGRGIMVLIDCCIYESRALNDRIFAHVDGRSDYEPGMQPICQQTSAIQLWHLNKQSGKLLQMVKGGFGY